MYTHEKKEDHICTSKNLKSMSEFDGLWKQQHNPLCCCFHSPSNSDMDLRFFDVHMWSLFFHACTLGPPKDFCNVCTECDCGEIPGWGHSARVFIKLTLNTKTSKSKKKKVDFRKHTDSLKIKISSYHSICIYCIMYTLRKLHSEKTAHCKLLQSGYHRQ